MDLMTFLLIKHFICDFPLQMNPWMYKNKGTYGHPGGVAHALAHFYGSMAVMLPFTSVPNSLCLALPIIDGILHYHIDWAKVNIGKKFNLKPDNSEWFWVLLGFDQLLHCLTYVGMVYLAGKWG